MDCEYIVTQKKRGLRAGYVSELERRLGIDFVLFLSSAADAKRQKFSSEMSGISKLSVQPCLLLILFIIKPN